MNPILWFKEIHFEDVAIVGGKGANLGEMYNLGIPVPNGFVVTAPAYFQFIEFNQLQPTIKSVLGTMDVDQPDQLLIASEKIKKLIKHSPIPQATAVAIMKAYKRLSDLGGIKNVPVAVRTSATAEDTLDASFAGQGETFLNVVGEANVINRVRDCWASLFTPRSIFYQVKKDYDHFQIGVAVPVQKLVRSDISGVCFTINPVTNEKNQIIIEAIWGLGEYIVQGKVTPDQYVVDKNTWEITSKTITPQLIELVKSKLETKEVRVPATRQRRSKISNELVVKIAKIAQKLHNHYGKGQDIEFAIENGRFYVVQTRPITTVLSSQRILDQQIKISSPADLRGEPASPGSASGEVIVIHSPTQIKRVKAGQILVTAMTTPDFVPAMKKASGIITDKGGQTSHAAIVSRELGVPCVVGTRNATKVLKGGSTITLNGTTGEVWFGNLISQQTVSSIPKVKSTTKTATKLYVNLGEPQQAAEVAKLNIDGVGLLRAEFMMANIGIHPKKMITLGKQYVFSQKLANDILKFTRSFNPRPVIYRASDFKTNEYRYLKWGKAYEPEEPNPLLGFRGAIRYINSPDVFGMEIEAIKIVRNHYGFKNLWLMIPFVRSPQELAAVKKILADHGLLRSPTFRLLMMVEIPCNVILLKEFIKVGIDGVSIGSNDLTMLTLGLDRDNNEVAPAFNELDPAVLWSLKRTVTIAKKYGITSSICGQAPSNHPDLVEKLVKWGISSISVSPDAIDRTRDIIAWVERSVK